jgi:hypothetical protein
MLKNSSIFQAIVFHRFIFNARHFGAMAASSGYQIINAGAEVHKSC